VGLDMNGDDVSLSRRHPGALAFEFRRHRLVPLALEGEACPGCLAVPAAGTERRLMLPSLREVLGSVAPGADCECARWLRSADEEGIGYPGTH